MSSCLKNVDKFNNIFFNSQSLPCSWLILTRLTRVRFLSDIMDMVGGRQCNGLEFI